MKLAAALAATFIVAITLCQAQDTDYSFKESYNVSTPARLSISSSDGNIDVVPSSGNTIEVFYIVHKGQKLLKISRAELEKEVTVNVVKTSSSVDIEVKYPDNYFSFGNNHMNISFKVLAPVQTACDMRTSDGNISMKGLTGTQKCRTSDGEIRVSTIKGDFTGKTSDGNVRASEVNGAVDLHTSDGNISLDNIVGNTSAGTSDGDISLEKLKGDINVSTSDGNITFKEINGSLTGTTSDGNVRGNMVTLTKNLTVRTSDGNIDVTIPANLGLDLDIKGESLNIPLNNFSGTSDEKIIRGKANGGGIAVNLSTNGNVSLTYK